MEQKAVGTGGGGTNHAVQCDRNCQTLSKNYERKIVKEKIDAKRGDLYIANYKTQPIYTKVVHICTVWTIFVIC